ncbi:MAG: polysaccharide deacetylase family protein [Acidibacillus sp.]|nr:polysaccharide deacetylase family protein [Acidibacillus sp.]
MRYVTTTCVFILAVFMFLTPFSSAKTQVKPLYVTFDDGPSLQYTPPILNILRKEHCKATFFILGYRALECPPIIRREIREGHQIGSHGYDHQNLALANAATIQEQIRKADDAIIRAGGIRPLYYRPPYGALDSQKNAIIQQCGHPIKRWDVDSLDWKATTKESIISLVEKQVKPGSVILFHDGITQSQFTALALPIIIRDLRKQGFVFRVLPPR